MAYDHGKYEVTLLGTGDNQAYSISGAAVGMHGSWSPGFQPHIVRAISGRCIATGGMTTGAVFSIRNVAGSTSSGAQAIGATGDQFTSITFLTGDVASGKVRYVQNLSTKIPVGSSLIASITGIAAAKFFTITALVEPTWETPANSASTMATG